MKKQFILTLLLLFLSLLTISAQNSTQNSADENKTDSPGQSSKDTISGGVVNGKALRLPKPVYPTAARLVGVGGAVSVQVLIDEKGNVMSANAVAGHPLLRGVSETAARGAKFLPTTLEGIPVKVSGIIVYVYNVPMSYLSIGYNLARAEKSTSPTENFPSFLIESNLPKSWKEEKEDVEKLGLYFRWKETKRRLEIAKAENPPDKDKTSESSIEKNKTTGQDLKGKDTLKARRPRVLRTTVGTDYASPRSNPDIKNLDATGTLQNLQTKIKARLSSDEKMLWYFKFGTILGSIEAEIEDEEKMRSNIAELTRIINEAPAGISISITQRAKEIVEFYQPGDFDEKKKQALIPFIRRLQKMKIN